MLVNIAADFTLVLTLILEADAWWATTQYLDQLRCAPIQCGNSDILLKNT